MGVYAECGEEQAPTGADSNAPQQPQGASHTSLARLGGVAAGAWGLGCLLWQNQDELVRVL
jgi:hypothetical protein